MVSYARLSIIKDWRRNIAIIILLAIAGLLMNFVISTYVQFLGASTEGVVELNAPIWLIQNSEDYGFSMMGRAIRQENAGEQLVWMHKDVISVRPVYNPVRAMVSTEEDMAAKTANMGRKNQNPRRRDWARFAQRSAELVTVGLEENDVTYPRAFPQELKKVLSIPGAVVARRNDVNKLGLKVGDKIGFTEQAGYGMAAAGKPNIGILAAVIEETSNFWSSRFYASKETVQMLSGGKESSNSISGYAIGIREGRTNEEVASEIRHLLSQGNRGLSAMTLDEIINATGEASLMENQGGEQIKQMAYIVSGFVLLIATLIMRTNFLAQLKEFGTLNALGLSQLRLANLLLHQGFWVGLAGALINLGLFFILKHILIHYDVILATTPKMQFGIFVMLVTISTVASFLSAFVLRKIELTSLLR